ncbi:LysR family transcriptional regulator, partial [Vibrio fluvialis]|nr:LysR family transcriptional regulator [Vibrio fluvialis]
IKAEELQCKKVADLVLVLVSTKPDDADSVFENRYVYVDWGARFASEHADRHPKAPAPFLRTSTARIALDFILEKGGSAYLPQTMGQPLLDAGQLHRVSEVNDWQRPLYLSYRKNSSSIEAIVQVEKLMKTLDPFSVVRTVGKVEAV